MNYFVFLTLIISTMMMCLLLVYSFLHAKKRGVRYVVWIMAFRVIFGCSIILELYSMDLSVKLLFRQIEQTTLVMVVPLIVLCVLDLFGRDEWLKWYKQVMIFLVFIGWSVLIWTNDKTGLVYQVVRLVDGHLEVTKTSLAIGFSMFCFILLMICVYFLIHYFKKVRHELWKPGIFIILLASIPGVVEAVKLLSPNFTVVLLPVSVYCSLFGFIALWIIYRNEMFAIVPMARDFIIDTIREGILTVDQHGTVIDCNPYIQPLFERNNMDIIGKDTSELLARWPEWLKTCQEMKENTVEITCKINGNEKHFLTKVYPLYSRKGLALGSVSILIDITEKQERLEEIVRLNFMKDQLFTLVSHDIREPIATQVALIEMLEEEKRTFTPENAEITDFLSGQIRSTYMTVNNVLEWFRTQKDDLVLNPESLILFDLVEEAYRILFIKSMVKQIKLNIVVDEKVYVYADREAIVMVIRNLLSNAIKFSKRGSIVEISAVKDDGKVIITVRDQGIGMTKEKIRQFFNGEQFISTIGTEGEKGTGLGLQVSRQFIKMSGSDLHIESEVGIGSTFHFLLKEGDRVESNYC